VLHFERVQFVSNQAIETGIEAELRLRALARLTGRADAADPRANSAAALSVLYELASSPSTAGDALALLHEIQVHQVEVELQAEELRRSRVEIEAELARYVQLYELAPFAYFSVDADSVICEANLAGARLLGAPRDALLGRRLDQLLASESGAMLRRTLADARDGAAARTLTLHLAAPGSAHGLRAWASAEAVGGRFLVAITDAGIAARDS
jgi:PAS domain S-box-containing protein